MGSFYQKWAWRQLNDVISNQSTRSAVLLLYKELKVSVNEELAPCIRGFSTPMGRRQLPGNEEDVKYFPAILKRYDGRVVRSERFRCFLRGRIEPPRQRCPHTAI